MPIRNKRVKRETRVAKVISVTASGCLKATELSGRGSLKDAMDASQVCSLSDSQSRWDSTLKKSAGKSSLVEGVNPHIAWIPVLASTGKPLMPTRTKRARKLVKAGKAIGKWKVGIFYIQLLDREDGVTQSIAVGIDPGSKREAFTVKSSKQTYLNVLSDAVTHVKEAVDTRKQMRRARRSRKTPCRQNRENRARGSLPPSTRARWQAKLRIVNILAVLFPVTTWIVEDIKANTWRSGKKWNSSFSPIEIGKKWFYDELRKKGDLALKQGYDTKEMRDALGLVKTKGKMEEVFSAHNVDSWVLANSVVGGHTKTDNTAIWRMIPLRFHRRQLHRLQATAGKRISYGGTMSCGLKRGTLAKHVKWGICYIGGSMDGKVSLHSLDDGTRICQNAKIEDLKVLRFGSWRYSKAA